MNAQRLPESGFNSAWFCVRTRPRHEHIAAAGLRQHEDIEVFLPRVRFQRSTRRGLAWVTEALFTSYLFARFQPHLALRRIQASQGVAGVVHFGPNWPTLPDHVIKEIQALMGPEEVHVIQHDLHPGDPVEIASGTFQGLRAVVTRIVPARQRVAVLLDFLGRQTMVELDMNQIFPDTTARGV